MKDMIEEPEDEKNKKNKVKKARKELWLMRGWREAEGSAINIGCSNERWFETTRLVARSDRQVWK